MINQSKKYRRIVDDLVKKSFSELKKSWIIVSYFNFSKGDTSAAVIPFFVFNWIILFKKSANYSQDVLVGLFCHELSHLAIIKNMSFFEKIFYFWSWPFSKKKRADFERMVDIEVIKRGYGKERIKLNEIIFEGKTKGQIKERGEKGYLSNKEIKQEMKKLK